MRRRSVDQTLIQMMKGKNPRDVPSKTIDDYKRLVKLAGVTVNPRSAALKDPKDLVARLKLLVSHLDGGGNAKSVRKEIVKIGGTLQRQGYLSKAEKEELVRAYGSQ